MPSLIDQLSISLKEENTGQRRAEWAEYIIKNNIPLSDLIGLLDFEKPVPMRFIWLVGDLCERQPQIIHSSITTFYARRNEMKFPNFDRSLAKIFWLSGIPDEIEGEAADEMFKWMLDPKISVSTKNYSLFALYNLSKKHPELKNELKIVIEDQLNKNSTSFEKRAKKILAELNQK
jgi:hypothetical protein